MNTQGNIFKAIVISLIICMMAVPGEGWGQTNPSAQSLPYSQVFSSLAHSSTTYPAGWQGWTISTSPGSSFNTNAPTADRALTASSTAATTSGNVHNYDGKIGFLNNASLDLSLVLAISTTGKSSVQVSYDIMTIRNPYDGGSNTRINEVTLQYRVGISGSFTNLTGIEYQNNTTTQTTAVNTPQNSQTKNITLPSACDDKSVVQLRWASRQVSGGGARPSFAVDAISIDGSSGSTPTITVGSIDGFGNQTVNTTSTEKSYSVSGSDLTENITITPPSGFEISKTSGSGYVANPNTLTLEQSGGTVNSTTIYVVFKPTAVTSYSGNITHVSSGATTQNVAASGTGTSPANPASFTATSAGVSQINLSAAANANSNNIVVVWDGDGSFTVPTDGVAAGNVGDAFADGTIHYKGAAGSLGNHTGLNPNSAYYYKAFSYDASNYYSSGSTANATTSKVEPSNHPSGFTASVATPTYSAITVTWTDATGATLPDAYLIKGSSVSYAAIANPVDGTAEIDGGLVKNITQGTQTHTFTGLTSSTPYYFKIYPYTNSGTLIDYKTDGTIQQSTATTTEGPSYEIGDFGFTAASGNWGTTNANWKQWDGTGWNTTPSGVPTSSDNVFILNGNNCILEVSGKNCKNLTVESGAKLYANNTTMGNPRYVNVYGNITADGTIGNGAGNDDVISFNTNGTTSMTISGAGTFTANRMRRNAGTGTLVLNINMDVELRYNGSALYNATGSAFQFDIGSGSHLNLTGNGITPSAGLSLSATDQVSVSGKLTVTGELVNPAGNTGITIKSTASGTGSLIHNTANIKGTVEKYITAWQSSYGGFHFLSSPVVTENIRPVFVPSSNPIGANQDFYQWDEATNTWINTRKEDDTWNEAFETTFTLGKGYLVAYASNSTKYFRDSLNVAPVPISNLSNTNGKTYAGWHLLGNPFPCAIKWGQGTWNRSAGIGAFAQVWNGDAASYKVLAGEGIIPAMNGFMVYTSASGGSLTIPADARLHSDSSWYKSSDPEQIVLVAKDMEKGYYQESVIAFQPGASAGFDLQEDCRYLGGYAPLFCSMAEQTRLALNTLPMESAHREIPLYFRKNESGTFRIILTQSLPGSKVTLTDLLLSKTVNLSDVHEYAFTSEANDDPNRFVLNYAPVGLEEGRDGQPAVSMYHSTDKVTIKSNDGRPVNGNVMVFNMVGQVVMEKAISGTMESFTIHAPNGYYIVKLVTDGNILTRKVFVQRAN